MHIASNSNFTMARYIRRERRSDLFVINISVHHSREAKAQLKAPWSLGARGQLWARNGVTLQLTRKLRVPFLANAKRFGENRVHTHSPTDTRSQPWRLKLAIWTSDSFHSSPQTKPRYVQHAVLTRTRQTEVVNFILAPKSVAPSAFTTAGFGVVY